MKILIVPCIYFCLNFLSFIFSQLYVGNVYILCINIYTYIYTGKRIFLYLCVRGTGAKFNIISITRTARLQATYRYVSLPRVKGAFQVPQSRLFAPSIIFPKPPARTVNSTTYRQLGADSIRYRESRLIVPYDDIFCRSFFFPSTTVASSLYVHLPAKRAPAIIRVRWTDNAG